MRDASARQRAYEQREPLAPRTGIRRDELGAWDAIIDGRVVATFRGTGSKLRAIRRAGTNVVIA